MRKDPIDDLTPDPLSAVDFGAAEQSLSSLNEGVTGLEEALIAAREREQKLAAVTGSGDDLNAQALRQTFPSLNQ